MKTIIRKADSNWKGDLESGHGLVSTESRTLNERPFTFSKRTDEGTSADHTNPEELIGAAAASCFAMALSKTLQDDGVISETIRVGADVVLALDDGGPRLSEMTLNIEAIIPEYSDEQLGRAVEETAQSCPVYQLLEPGFGTINLNFRLQR
ncbi:MAG: OsmC family peroxiredoxin [Puniceicoccaceae bacterium]